VEDIGNGLPTRTAGYAVAVTEPDKDNPLSRAHELESIVDELDEKVAGEREAERVPGKPSDRENAAIRVSESEPPD
jgi:hypothetical protein